MPALRYVLPLMFLLGLSASAGAIQLRETDCARSPFRLSDAGYQMECEYSEDRARAGQSAGTIRLDVMTITSDSRQMFLTMTVQTISGTRLYFEYRNLESSFHSVFFERGITQWRSVDRKNGYEVAEFVTEVSGTSSHCIAVQRYGNPAWTGYKRHIVGMGCAPHDLTAVYDVLAKLLAPGD